ncbi:hypothetical protein [Psychrobium sp. 1_MG-2023]|uniref:BufA2 family periplasmic bufferin-type metallophore n=1 Tax=Psychrobium sp. 1_MG-2023 TaxID=3062624 RepID=UPI000C345E0A|nr:hypothetical protein [Psychrobium sp. 1_MG-2023]MDP2561904.1 hypothetical protein [Psychrobium sp. 1_MG-2023]PKF59680.1 hypothetical protein CW748_00310 [Alteromonadales bacterium alter-6D02]
MSSQLKTKIGGATLAMAAATLMGCQATTETTANNAASKAASSTVELVHCYGVNTCKGHNDCKTASNGCKGMASCKGHGFVAMPSQACMDVGGNIKDNWIGKTTKVDLVHCYGVNICKGHNDCKTATNACKGMASCQGLGFVATTAASCKDIGGNTDA